MLGKRKSETCWSSLPIAAVVAGLILTAAQSVAAVPVIGTGIQIDQRNTSSESSENWPYAAVAFDGENFLVVWINRRHLETTSAISTYGVYGARFNQSGSLLDPLGILIATAEGASRPDVAFDGTNYLVVWQEKRGNESEIRGGRVSKAGVPLDTTSLSISTPPMRAYAPKVAFDGDNYLVVWWDLTGSIYAERVTPAGVVLDGGGVELTTSSYQQVTPAVACDGTNCLVVWEEEGHSSSDYAFIGVTRVSKSGVALDGPGAIRISAFDDQRRPAVAFDGTNYVLSWEQGPGGGIAAARVSIDAQVLDPNGILLTDRYVLNSQPAIACHVGTCLVTWRLSSTGPDHVRGATLTASGFASPPGVAELWTEIDDTFVDGPALASDGTNYLVVWGTRAVRTDYPNVTAALVDDSPALVGSSPVTVASGANGEGEPAAAFDGTKYLVAWQDSRNGGDDVYAARVAEDGALIDSLPIVVSTAPNAQLKPRVAFGGTSHLVVWEDRRSDSNSDIYAARVSPSGTLIDPSGIAISARPGDQRLPAVAYGCDDYLVVWSDGRSGSEQLYAMRVSAEGRLLDGSGVAIAPTAPNDYAPAMVFDGEQYLVVWSAKGNGPDRDIYALRVNRAGTALDADPIVVTAAAGDQRAPSVAFDGTNYLVVWEDLSDQDSYSNQIAGALIARDGQRLAPGIFPISTPYGPQRRPAVAFDGTDYLVAWERTVAQALPNIEATRVMIDGEMRDAEPFIVTTAIASLYGTGAAETAATVVSTGDGRSLVLYRSSDEPSWGRAWHPWARSVVSEVTSGAGYDAGSGARHICGSDPDAGDASADADARDASADPDAGDASSAQPEGGTHVGSAGASGAASPDDAGNGSRPQSDAGVALMPDAGAARDGGPLDASDTVSDVDRSGCRCDLARTSRPLPWSTLALVLATVSRRSRRVRRPAISPNGNDDRSPHSYK